MKFVLLIILKLLTIANSFLLVITEHETFSANKYENANYCWHFHIYLQRKFMLSCIEHEKGFITLGPTSHPQSLVKTVDDHCLDSTKFKSIACD